MTSMVYCIYIIQVDRLEDELYQEQEKFKAITEELEQTFAEMSGY
jgi:tropomyosin 2